MAKQFLPLLEAYEIWASQYDHNGNTLTALDSLVLPQFFGEVQGRDVLDVGCGTGRHALTLADAGAHVVGVDQSAAMLNQAQMKIRDRAINFQQQDITAPLPFTDESFDLVLCALVVEHIENLPSLLREMRRLCRREGTIVISDMHPALRLRGTQANFTHPETGEDVWPPSLPRQVSDYVMSVLDAGLRLAEIREFIPTPEFIAANPRALKYENWPMLLVLRLCR